MEKISDLTALTEQYSNGVCMFDSPVNNFLNDKLNIVPPSK